MQERRTRSASPLPSWVDPNRLSKVFRASPCSTNEFGLKTCDHIDVRWPLPTMFGYENYAFSLINMADDRFTEESGEMSRKLLRLLYDYQIIELEWRKTYKQFIEAEQRLANLTPGVLQKSRDKAEATLAGTRDQLLRLQDQRDLFERIINKIWVRCREIRAIIKKEKDLEQLRMELSGIVKERFPVSDPFWKSKFKIRGTGHSVPPSKHHRHK